jgi:virginiamycin B lyase
MKMLKDASMSHATVSFHPPMRGLPNSLWIAFCIPLMQCSYPLPLSGSRSDAGDVADRAVGEVGGIADLEHPDCCRLLPGTIASFKIPATGGEPTGIAVGADGNLWFTEQIANQIGRITPAGDITEFPIPTADSWPMDIAAGPDGSLWFTESIRYRVGRITTEGKITEFLVPKYAAQPKDIVPGPDSNLWFTSETQIGRITTSGKITLYSVPTDISIVWGIAPGPDGALWFTETGANKLGRVSPEGKVSELDLSSTEMRVSRGVTKGPDNNMWIVGFGTASGGGSAIGRVTTGGVVAVFLSHDFGQLRSIVSGPDDNLWFTDWGGNAIGRITPDGVMTRFPLPDGVTYPWGIVSGPDGNLWFTYDNGIGRISP